MNEIKMRDLIMMQNQILRIPDRAELIDYFSNRCISDLFSMFFSEFVIYMVMDSPTQMIRVCNFNKEIAEGKYTYAQYSHIPPNEKHLLTFTMQGIVGDVAK